MSVTVDEILNAAQAGAASLTGETAGYVVLSAADRASEAPERQVPSSVVLAEDGSISVTGFRAGTRSELETELRGLLARMLSHAPRGVPALVRVGQTTELHGMGRLVSEIEAALIPVNRSAARRALSRLHRDVLRAKIGGLLAAPVPEPAEPVAAVKPLVATEVPRAVAVAEADGDVAAADQVVAAVVGSVVQADSSSQPARVEPFASVPNQPTPGPATPASTTDALATSAAPIPTSVFASVEVAEEAHFVEAPPPSRVFGARPPPLLLSPPLPTVQHSEPTPVIAVAESVARGADAAEFVELPIEVVVPEEETFAASVYEPEATPFLGSWPGFAPLVTGVAAPEAPAPEEHDTDPLPAVTFEEPSTPVPTPARSVPSVAAMNVAEEIPSAESDVPPSAVGVVGTAEPAPEVAVPPLAYKPRRSDVSELLAGFGVAESRSLRDISSELTRIAESSATPASPAVARAPVRKSLAR